MKSQEPTEYRWWRRDPKGFPAGLEPLLVVRLAAQEGDPDAVRKVLAEVERAGGGLAFDFAYWGDVKFQVWVCSMLDTLAKKGRVSVEEVVDFRGQPILTREVVDAALARGEQRRDALLSAAAAGDLRTVAGLLDETVGKWFQPAGDSQP